MSNEINNHEHDRNDFFNVDEDDINGYDLQTATAWLFQTFDRNSVSPSNAQLAERLIQQFPNAAQTFLAHGYLLLHAACQSNAPDAII